VDKLEILRKHLSLKVHISDSDFNKFIELTERVKLSKGEMFIREGRIAKHQAFLLSGVMGAYNLDAKGSINLSSG